MKNGDRGLNELRSKKDFAFLNVLRVLNVHRKVRLAEAQQEFHGHRWTSFFKRAMPQKKLAN